MQHFYVVLNFTIFVLFCAFLGRTTPANSSELQDDAHTSRLPTSSPLNQGEDRKDGMYGWR